MQRLCRIISEHQTERAKDEMDRWKELLTELGETVTDRIRVVRDHSTGPVGLKFESYYQFTLELSNDKDMLFWSPDSKDALPEVGVKSAKVTSNFIKEYNEKRRKAAINQGRERKWCFPDYESAWTACEALEDDGDWIYSVNFKGQTVKPEKQYRSLDTRYDPVQKAFRVLLYVSRASLGAKEEDKIEPANSYGVQLTFDGEVAVCLALPVK